MDPDRTDHLINFQIDYACSSYIGERGAGDCVTSFTAKIYAEYFNVDEDLDWKEFAGEMDFKVIHLGEAQDEGFNVFEVFDTWESTFQLGQKIYDFENDTLTEPVLQAFPELEIECRKILIIEAVGILPKFRGEGLAVQAFRDLFRHFNHSDLFVLEPFHLKMSATPKKESILAKLDLTEFQQIEEAAVHMNTYFRSWGFKEIKGIEELMFYCPVYHNEVIHGLG